MAVDIPDELIDQIYRGNTVLFVGAGLSAGAKFPRWRELMFRMIDWAEKNNISLNGNKEEFLKLIEEKEFLLVAEELRDIMSNELFEKFMRSVFRDDTKKPSPAHTILPGIPFAALLTTNYDVLLESVYTQYRGVRPHTCTHSDTPKLVELNKSNEFYILKMHGDIDQFETVVVSQSDYRQLMFKNKAYHDYLRTLFMTRTVFFVGFSLTDPDLMLLLDELGTFFKSYGGCHYALMNTKEAGKVKRRSFKKHYNIQIIPYEATKGHPEVYEILSEISEQVAEKIVSYVLKKVRPGLLSSNFIIRGPNPEVRKLFVRKLTEAIQKDKHHLSFVIKVDLEESPEQEFFQMLGNRLLETIKSENLSIEAGWNGKGTFEDISVFEKIVRDLISRIHDIGQKQLRIVLLLFNADIMNEFDERTKDGLKYILDVFESTLTAVIVAQDLDIEDSSRWKVSPWSSRFLSVRLE
jgi:hypothetical protein